MTAMTAMTAKASNAPRPAFSGVAANGNIVRIVVSIPEIDGSTKPNRFGPTTLQCCFYNAASGDIHCILESLISALRTKLNLMAQLQAT